MLLTTDDHETARLVPMEMGDQCSFVEFIRSMRENSEVYGLAAFKVLYSQYCGFDGKEVPTLSIETGERVRLR